MYAVILSGGVGSRLWPVSRKLHPKPFMKLVNGTTILHNTFLRSLQLGIEGIVNVTSSEFIFKVKKELHSAFALAAENNINASFDNNYILEPFGRGTAAALAISSLYLLQKTGDDATLLVLPSDHLIANQPAFAKAVAKATELAAAGNIVTFGIKPNSPETGYGYIEFDGNKVKRFVEKPSFDKATEYINSGRFLWNSGMFCFKAKVMLDEMRLYCPDILAKAEECLYLSKTQTSQINLDPGSFETVREDSIDYAIMEKSQKVAVVACDIEWNDIGSWSAVSQLVEPDADGNVVRAEAILEKVTNCYVESSDRVIGMIGVNNLIVVDTADALLIADKNNSQDVKKIYNKLVQSGHQTHETHQTVYRPWGSYTVLEESPYFKIKRIEVIPGESLSLQAHKHRSEHWVVVSGSAKVINGEQELYLEVEQSTYIPAGNKHRLSNPGQEVLVIIEVQTGSYLGEDDIQRFDDIYGRINQV